MHCLVTGGAGFIGGHLADRLIEAGHEVVVVDDLSTGFRRNVPDAARFHEIGLNHSDLADVFSDCRPDVVFHLAAQANVRKSVEDPAYDARQNVLGSINLFECARKTSVNTVIYSSTGGGVYGEPETLPVPEDHPINPLCPYGASKFTVEKYLELYGRLYGIRYAILRYANVYGPRQNPKGEAGVVAIFSRLMLRGECPHIFGDGTKTRDYVYVDDVVRANLLALEKPDGNVYNVGTGKQASDEQVYRAIRDAVGCDATAIYDDFQPGEVRHISLDTSRIRSRLGWRNEVSFDEGIERAVEFYRRQLADEP